MPKPPREVTILVSSALGAAALTYVCYRWRRRHDTKPISGSAYEALIGNTPTKFLPQLSKMLQCQVFVKLESANPGGTGKDRAAQRMIETAEQNGTLPPPRLNAQTVRHVFSPPADSRSIPDPDLELIQTAMQTSRTGGLVVEGTSGSTGIALATLCQAKGHAIIVIVPDDQAQEKKQLLETLGAVVHVVKVCSISHPQHYVKVAQRLACRAKQLGTSVLFPNQFENLDNYQVHFDTTGPEIYRHRPDVFVMSAGTGGTIAGVSRYLKMKNANTRIVLVDPEGSVLANKINHNVAFTIQQTERELLRHRYDSIAEGIGLDRVTVNFQQAIVDCAVTISDQDAVDMAHWILHHEGLLIGSSSAMNLVGVAKVAQPHQRVLTIVCDSGQRHLTRFWNRAFIESRGLAWPSIDHVPEFLLV